MSKLLEHYCDPMGRITEEGYARIGNVEPVPARGPEPMPEVRLRLLIAKVLLTYAEVAALMKAQGGT